MLDPGARRDPRRRAGRRPDRRRRLPPRRAPVRQACTTRSARCMSRDEPWFTGGPSHDFPGALVGRHPRSTAEYVAGVECGRRPRRGTPRSSDRCARSTARRRLSTATQRPSGTRVRCSDPDEQWVEVGLGRSRRPGRARSPCRFEDRIGRPGSTRVRVRAGTGAGTSIGDLRCAGPEAALARFRRGRSASQGRGRREPPATGRLRPGLARSALVPGVRLGRTRCVPAGSPALTTPW